MKRIHTRWLFGAVAALSLLPAVGSADRHDFDAVRVGDSLCLPARGRIEVTFVAEGCTSAVGLCTEGRIRPRGGFLTGTTEFTANGLGGNVVGEPSIVTPPVEPGTTWSYAGTITIHTPIGDLTTEDVGVFDTARGTFTEMNRVLGGTGLLEDATGDLFMSGHSYEDGSGFAGDVSGEVCIPRRHGWR